MQDIAASQVVYKSEYRHGVDEKRRLQIPAKWRSDTGRKNKSVEVTLLLWRKPKEGPCLRVLPPNQMAKMLADIDSLPNSDPGKVAMKRSLGRDSVDLEMDRAGRICIPEGMASAAGITNEAVLVGLFDKYEIWSPNRYDAVQKSDADLVPPTYNMME